VPSAEQKLEPARTGLTDQRDRLAVPEAAGVVFELLVEPGMPLGGDELLEDVPDQPPLLSVAVNVPSGESDVRRTTTLEEQQVQVAPEATTAREPLDRHLAAAAAVLLVGAAFLGRRRTPEDPDAAGSPAEAA
jgi:hypothetical protein